MMFSRSNGHELPESHVLKTNISQSRQLNCRRKRRLSGSTRKIGSCHLGG